MRAEHTRILFLAFLWGCGVQVGTIDPPSTTTFTPRYPRNQCDFRPLEASIRRLEGRIDERVNALSNDIRSSSIHAEHQSKEIEKAVSDCRNDIERFAARTRRDSAPQNIQTNPNFDEKLEDLSRKLQVTIASLHLIDTDLAIVKTNLSDVLSITNNIWEKIDTESSIQNVFTSPSNQPPPTLDQVPPMILASTPKNCKEIQQSSLNSQSGIYLVQPETSKPPFMVFCDMAVKDGGWLTIHSRYEGSQEFYLGWQDYKVGFGNIAGEFWLGLEKIYQLTGNKLNELLIEIVDPDKIRSMAYYAYFSIGSEEEGYALKVLGGYKGNAGDALGYQAGSKFSTKDKDQDSWSEGNCAQSHHGAWWYKACEKSNLNGRYIPGPQPDQLLYQAMYWGATTNPQIGLGEARMLIRPRDDLQAELLPNPL